MTGKKDINDKIHELEGMISAYHNLIRTTRTNIANTEFVDKSIADHKAKIKWHQKMIDQLEHSRDNGDKIIEEAQVSLKNLRKKVNLLKHKRDIEKVVELQRKINELEAEIKKADET